MTAEKAALRATIRADLAAMTPAEAAAQDAAVREHLRRLIPADGLVLAYVAMSDEVDLGPLIAPLEAAGRLVLPRVAPQRRLVLHRASGARVAGALGLSEPAADAPEVDAAAVAVVLVPGRAFDAAGRRLGRKGGYYDRLLPQVTGRTIGVARRPQVVDEVPVDPWDHPVDLVVSPDGVVGGRGQHDA